MKTIKEKLNFRFIRNILFFIGLIFITFFFIFKDQDMEQLFNIVISANDLYILLGLFCMVMFYSVEAINIRSILKCFGEKVSFLKSLKFTLIGFFFSAITPAATGGQPVEVYYMNKEKISAAKSTLALLMQLCAFQISTLTYGIICAILNPSMLSNGLIWLFLLGFLINSLALSVMLICIFSKRLTKKLIDLFINILRIFKVKDLELKKAKIEEGLEKYNSSSNFIKSHKSEFVKSILRGFLQIGFYYLVPFCVYKAFGLNDLNIFQLFSMQAILYTTVSGIPLPGAIGISETVFLGLFEVAFGKELISGSMLLSRGITFYFFVIVSLLVVFINVLRVKNNDSEIDSNVKELEEEIEKNDRLNKSI